MEKIKLLCYENGNNDISCSLSFIALLKQSLGINVKIVAKTCLADFIFLKNEVDEEDLEYFDPINAVLEFEYQSKKFQVNMERISQNDNRIFKIEIEYLEDDNISDLDNSVLFNFKENLINLLANRFENIHWLYDSQNKKIATYLYSRLYDLENYLREIIDYYMCIMYGGNWFKKYSYEDFLNQYNKFSEWFSRSNYNLFKKIDNHLFNLEIDDIFNVLKTAKKEPITKNVEKALKDIKAKEKENAATIANIDLLDFPSLWEEENFDEIFNDKIVGRWQNDLSKRRNMVAHNKMICRKMYFDTISTIDFFYDEFKKSEKKLKNRIRSDEYVKISQIQRDFEIQQNLEYCDLRASLLDEQEIIEQLNETNDFMQLSEIINNYIIKIGIHIDELEYELKEIEAQLNYNNFFKDDKFVGVDLLRKFVELAKEHKLYYYLVALLNNEIYVEIYELIESVILDCISSLKIKLNLIKDSVHYSDLECFCEGDLVQLQDFEENTYKISILGYILPVRGSTDEIYVDLTENGQIIDRGNIIISYGDYEMTDDDIPIPCTEDAVISDFASINNKMEEVVVKLFNKINKLEEIISDIEI